MKTYFTLNPECILVKGALRGTVYDLKSGNVFSVDEISIKILDQLNSGKNFLQVLKDNDISQEKLVAYLDSLENCGMGNWSEKYNKTIVAPPDLNKALRYVLHLELTTGCNLRCLHCYNESEISKLHNNNEVSVDDWKRTITEAYQIGCRRIQFIGGEPFLKRELMYELILFARDMGYTSLEVSTNGTLITEKDLYFLKNHNTSLAFSFYSYRPQTHDLITTREGSWKKTLQVIQLALRIVISFRVSVVEMRWNKEEVKETVDFLKSLEVENVKSTAVEPS